MTYLTVKELYEKYPNTEFYKLLYKDETYNYKTGLNIN